MTGTAGTSRAGAQRERDLESVEASNMLRALTRVVNHGTNSGATLKVWGAVAGLTLAFRRSSDHISSKTLRAETGLAKTTNIGRSLTELAALGVIKYQPGWAKDGASQSSLITILRPALLAEEADDEDESDLAERGSQPATPPTSERGSQPATTPKGGSQSATPGVASQPGEGWLASHLSHESFPRVNPREDGVDTSVDASRSRATEKPHPTEVLTGEVEDPDRGFSGGRFEGGNDEEQPTADPSGLLIFLGSQDAVDEFTAAASTRLVPTPASPATSGARRLIDGFLTRANDARLVQGQPPFPVTKTLRESLVKPVQELLDTGQSLGFVVACLASWLVDGYGGEEGTRQNPNVVGWTAEHVTRYLSRTPAPDDPTSKEGFAGWFAVGAAAHIARKEAWSRLREPRKTGQAARLAASDAFDYAGAQALAEAQGITVAELFRRQPHLAR